MKTLLDPSLLRAGRLDFILRFPLPNEKERFEIFRVHAGEKPVAKDVRLPVLARLTEGMAGSQIASICRNATMAAISEVIQTTHKKSRAPFLIKAKHFEEAIRREKKKEEPVHAEGR